MEQIVYKFPDHTDEELKKYRALWDEIFEDPKAFSDYYFANVCTTNRLLGAYDNGKLIGMVHANPYRVKDSVKNCVYNCYYIVGVAVRPEYRNQGYMRSMMCRMMNTLKEEDCPFVFLMPKNKSYYHSLGFITVYDTKVIICRLMDNTNYMDCLKHSGVIFDRIDKKTKQSLVKYSNTAIANQYRFFSERTSEYFMAMMEEHTCQNGNAVVVRDREIIVGTFAYAVYDSIFYVERMEVYCEEALNVMTDAFFDLAQKEGCITMELTVAARYADKIKEEIHQKTELRLTDSDNIMHEHDGYGIMACALQDDFSVNEMKNMSFFNEIV
ncbi:MAG: GNAT family N-acetyltransferase [Eubacteriales bacterium]|nr:GNAT family N-acetyltransferase [Eubacteriales bacterium]